MPRVLIGCLILTGVAVAGSVCAQDGVTPKGVVELFTSQGCSSCPPADAVLEKLIDQGDVVALSYHVDYWNYLGWADTMSSKENTARQYAYAKSLGRSNVYTPQAVINGRDHMNGADLGAINGKLDAFKKAGEGLNVDVGASMQGDELAITIGAGQGKANVVIAYFDQEQTVTIKKGENVDRKVAYWHTVTDVQTVGMWDGKAMRLVLPSSLVKSAKKDGCAVLLQTSGPEGEPGTIMGAAVLLVGAER